MILNQILKYKRREIERAKKKLPLAKLAQKLASRSWEKRSFRAAVSNKTGVRLICELKQASPSGGVLRKHFNPVRIAREFERAGACAISVLTERRFFKGSPEFLSRVRAATKLPVLRKDFIVEPYQVYETALMGADAMLLIASILSGRRIRELTKLARQFRIEALVEVHNERELKKALGAGAGLIGINNRDLKTLRIDLSVADRIIPLVPKGITIVIESGIESREHAARYQKRGVNAFLVGTSLMRAPNVGHKIKELKNASG